MNSKMRNAVGLGGSYLKVHYTIGGRLIRWRWQDGLQGERLGTGRPFSRYIGNTSSGRG